jgi:hypothetical protein
MAQYQALVDAGYEFYLFDDSSDPYAGNPWKVQALGCEVKKTPGSPTLDYLPDQQSARSPRKHAVKIA